MKEIFWKDLETQIKDGRVSEVDIVSISFAGVDEINTTLRCGLLSNNPFRWMSFEVKRFTYPGVSPMYETIQEEESAIAGSLAIYDDIEDLMMTIHDFFEDEKGGPCHQKFHSFVDRENVIIIR